MHSEAPENPCDPIPRVEHARLHGAGWNASDRRDLLDRSPVVVNEVNDLTMHGRQLRQAVGENCAVLLLLDRRLGSSA